MSAALLDLTAHDLDEIPGKYIVINGARYTIGELIGEGGESSVFGIRNDATKLSIFVLKINRFLPGSPEFAETRDGRAKLLFALKGGLASETDPTHKVLVPDEIYEQNGGLIDLQRNVDGVSDPDYFAPEVRHVWDLYSSGRDAEALVACDAVLAKNPNHTHALQLKASCLSRADRIFDGIDLLERAIELEPNDAHTYHLLADFWLAVGGAEPAVRALQRTLNRYSLDYETWVILTRMAIKYDLTHLANEQIQAGFHRLGDGPFIEKLRQDYEMSRARTDRYRLLLEKAAEAQNSGQWLEAMGALDTAIATSNSNTLAHANRCICLYNLGRTDDLMAAAGTLLQGVLHTNERSATGLLMLLASIATSKDTLAITVASLIERNAQHPIDLPLIPTLVTGRDTVSGSDTRVILSALNDLASRVESPDALNVLRELAGRDKQLTGIIAGTRSKS